MRRRGGAAAMGGAAFIGSNVVFPRAATEIGA